MVASGKPVEDICIEGHLWSTPRYDMWTKRMFKGVTPIDLSKWMIKVKQKCKVLCLHALRSNESVMKMQISSWKKVLADVADFHVINAPIANTGPPFPEIQA